MENPRVCFVDDAVQSVGGTSLTLNAIVEPNKKNVTFISTSDFALKNIFEDYDLFVLGNIMAFSTNSLDAIMMLIEERSFVKIEFDYGYCQYRGNVPHKILGNADCECPYGEGSDPILKKLYSSMKRKASHFFYMSESQMRIHDKHLLGIPEDKKSVLSSCFTKDTLLKFKSLREKPKNNKYAIIDGNGGWHTQAKGIKQSIKYANDNNLDFDLIKTETHEEMMEKMSNYKGLISFPIIDDTCPRITLEARYMGLEVITNNFSQHITESWWKASDKEALKFTSSRPTFFWDKIKCLKY